MSGLEISLLGGCHITWEEKPVKGLETPRPQALLAYLLLQRGAPISRQQLAFQFWPESSEGQARTNLRHLVHSLRSALPQGETFLLGEAQEIAWNSQAPYTLDVEIFEASLDEARSTQALRRALDLYRGDLLPICYDEWILPQRERLFQLYLAGLERLATWLEQSGDLPPAIQVMHRLLQRDPVNEGAYQRLISLQMAENDRAGALHTYQTYITTFQRDLGLAPSPAMQQVYENLTGSRPSELIELRPGLLRLVGREGEWKRLLSAWRTAASGRPSLVMLEGETGIGKTRLAEELLAWVERQGQRGLLASGYPAEASLAYAPVATWLRSGPLPALEPLYLSEVARLLPEILNDHPNLPQPAPLAEAWQRQRLHESLAQAVLRGGLPALLVLDDLQWCDADSLEWLSYLLRYDPNASLMVLATLRSEDLDADHPLGRLLAGLRRNRQLVEIALGPLDEPQGAELALQAAAGELETAQALSIHYEAEGNPLFIVELAQSSQDRSVFDPTTPALPAGLQAAISTRLERLSAQARRVGELAAVIGRQFSYPVLAKAAGEDEKSLIEGLDELWLRRIVREQGAEGYDFSHEMIRQVMYGELSQARRRWLHRQVAETLERLQSTWPESSSGEIASHYDRAGLAEKALAGYQAAALEAQHVYAYRQALVWLQQAQALIHRLSDQAQRRQAMVQISESLGDVLKTLAQRPQAVQAYQQALSMLGEADLLRRACLSRKQGDVWVEDLRYEAAWDCFSQAQFLLESNPQEQNHDWQREWLQARLAQMHWHYWLYQWEQIANLAEQIQAQMERSGTPLQQVEYYHLLARKTFLQSGFLGSEASRAAATKALRAAQETGDENTLLTTRFSYGFQLLWSGDLEPAAQEISQALASARSMGNLLLETQSLTYLTILERRRGNLEQVANLAQQSLLAAQTYQRADYIGVAQANLAWLAWRRGDMKTAGELGQAALETWEAGRHPYPIQWLGLWPMIAIRLAQGQVEEAARLARRLLDPGQQRTPVKLAALLEEITQTGAGQDAQATRGLLERALDLAQALDFL